MSNKITHSKRSMASPVATFDALQYPRYKGLRNEQKKESDRELALIKLRNEAYERNRQRINEEQAKMNTNRTVTQEGVTTFSPPPLFAPTPKRPNKLHINPYPGNLGGRRKTHKKKSHKKTGKSKRRSYKYNKRKTSKRGGVRPSRPPTPPMTLPGTPVMNAAMDNLQRFWINPDLYPRYINEAFEIITDIRSIEALYREGELNDFFRLLVIPRFITTIESDRSNWDLIHRHLSSGETGRIVVELREINIIASQEYQRNIVRIARMNPNTTGGNSRKNKKTCKRKR